MLIERNILRGKCSLKQISRLFQFSFISVHRKIRPKFKLRPCPSLRLTPPGPLRLAAGCPENFRRPRHVTVVRVRVRVRVPGQMTSESFLSCFPSKVRPVGPKEHAMLRGRDTSRNAEDVVTSVPCHVRLFSRSNRPRRRSRVA